MTSHAKTQIDYNEHPRVNSADPVPPRPRPAQPAHVVTSDAEAIEIAHRLAEKFKEGAALRDREGLLPIAELDEYSQSGLWSINVPKAYGGPEVSYATLAKVIEIIASADPAIAQITQNHWALVATVDLDGTEAQKQLSSIGRSAASATAMPSRNSRARTLPPSRRRFASKAMTPSSTARSSTRRVRCSRMSFRSLPSTRRGRAIWSLPIAMRRA